MDRNQDRCNRKRTDWKSELREWVIILVLAIVAAMVLNSKVIVNAQIPSASMENTIHPGDRIFGNRLAYLKEKPQRFDVVIFRFPDDENQIFIKRIIGLPGETVHVTDGKVYIGDSKEALDDSFLPEKMQGSFGTFVVPDDSYFVLGDNRNNSLDSRFWKNTYVPAENILGKAYFRYWPLDNMGKVE